MLCNGLWQYGAQVMTSTFDFRVGQDLTVVRNSTFNGTATFYGTTTFYLGAAENVYITDDNNVVHTGVYYFEVEGLINVNNGSNRTSMQIIFGRNYVGVTTYPLSNVESIEGLRIDTNGVAADHADSYINGIYITSAGETGGTQNGIKIAGTQDNGIYFYHTLKQDANRANSFWKIGTAHGTALPAFAMSNNFDATLVNLVISSVTGGAGTTVNLGYYVVAATTGNCANGRFKCFDSNTNIAVIVTDAYVYQGEIALSGTGRATTECCVAGFLLSGAAGAASGLNWAVRADITASGLPTTAGTSACIFAVIGSAGGSTYGSVVYEEVRTLSVVDTFNYIHNVGTCTSYFRINEDATNTFLFDFDTITGCVAAQASTTPAHTLACRINGVTEYIKTYTA